MAKGAPVALNAQSLQVPPVAAPLAPIAAITIQPGEFRPKVANVQQQQALVFTTASPSGSVHSVPAALRGLCESACPLSANAARRKALVIGCTYYSSHAPLSGTMNDAWNILSLLRHSLQFTEEQVQFLIDGSQFCCIPQEKQPTRANILRALHWLTADASPGDEFFFYFSGYGTQQPITNGLQEAFLAPTDFGDELPQGFFGRKDSPWIHTPQPVSAHYRLIPLTEVTKSLAKLPSSCRVTLILDCGLPILPGLQGASTPFHFPTVTMKPDKFGEERTEASAFSPRQRYLHLLPIIRTDGTGQLPESSCAVQCFCACQRHQWCAELPIEGVMQGAFTWAWIKATIAGNLQPTARQRMEVMKTIILDLRNRFTWLEQEPVLLMSAAASTLESSADPRIGLQLTMPQPPLPPNHQRRKALLIGINYVESHAPLKGCVNDAWNMYYLLRYTFQYGEDQIRLLIDGENGQAPRATQVPSKANIIAGIQWLLAGTQAGDDTLFHFSGYGAQHPQKPGSELHEAYIVPADFAADLPVDFFSQREPFTPPQTPPQNNLRGPPSLAFGYRLVSFVELNRFLAQAPAAMRATVILDCAYPVIPGVDPSRPVQVAFPKVERGRVNYRKLHDFVSRPRFLELVPLPVQHTPANLSAAMISECAVFCFSSCRLQEWDAEFPLEGTVQGAFTWAVCKALAARRFQCRAHELQQAVAKITTDLKLHFKGVEQTPILEVSRSASAQDKVLGM